MPPDDVQKEQVEVVQYYGIEVPLDRRVISEGMALAIREGRYEKGEAKWLPKLVREGERIVEIGACTGLITALLATKTPAELVVGVEPNPQLIDLMAEVHRLNGARTVIRHAMVTPQAHDGPADFFLHEDVWSSSSLQVRARSQAGKVQVPTISVAEIAETWRPSLLIIDLNPLMAWVQAEEPPHMLAGADFRPFERVVVELKPKLFPPPHVKRVFDHFSAQGFAYDPALSNGDLVLFGRIDD